MINGRNDGFNQLPQSFDQLQQQQQGVPNTQGMFVGQQASLLGYGGSQLPQLMQPSLAGSGEAYINQMSRNPYNQAMQNVTASHLNFNNFHAQSDVQSGPSQMDNLMQNTAFQQNFLNFQGQSQQALSQQAAYGQPSQSIYPHQQSNYLGRQSVPNLMGNQLYVQQQQELYLQQQQQQHAYLQSQQVLQGQQHQHSSQVAFSQPIAPDTQQMPPAQVGYQLHGVSTTSKVQQQPAQPAVGRDPIVIENPKKAAERASITAAENTRKMKERAEEEERGREEQVRHEQQQIESDFRKTKASASEFSAAMKARLDAIPEPIHLAGCHTLTKVGSLLPLPSECTESSDLLPIKVFGQVSTPISQSMANYMVELLNASMTELNDIELRHSEDERNDLNLDEMKSLCLAIHRIDPNALNVEKEYSADNVLQFDQDIQRVVDEVTGGNFDGDNGPSPDTAQHADQDDKNKRKKKDMVGELYDSLTGYFDPSTSRRRKPEDGDQNDDAQRSAADREVTKFFDHPKPKKPKQEVPARPPTPEEIIHQREREWNERVRLREEKLRRRRQENVEDVWSNEVMAENECLTRFIVLTDSVVDQVSDIAIDDDFTVDTIVLEDLRMEVSKLKDYGKVKKVPAEKLTKLLSILDKLIKDVINEDGAMISLGNDEMDKRSRDEIDDKIVKASDAALIAMHIMTSPKMPKIILMEDCIEKSIQLAKEVCQHIVYPAFDPTVVSGDNALTNKIKKASEAGKKRKTMEKSNPFAMSLYRKVCDLVHCFAQLSRFENLNETLSSNLCTLGTPSFFVDGVGELQVACIGLLSTTFSTVPSQRKSILQELLESIRRLPSTKHQRNSYRLSETVWISNFAVLILHLIQSVVKVPSKRRNDALDETDDIQQNDITVEDKVVIETYQEAQALAAAFFSGFLTKCTSKSKEDYRRLFELFLQDLLVVLNRPTYPVAELLLTVLGNLLVKKFRSDAETTLRIACLDYLGTITARLRKDRVNARGDDKSRLDLVVKTVVSEERGESLDEVDIGEMSTNDKIQKLEQTLIDYILQKSADDFSVENTVLFYVAEWYRETVADIETAKERHRQALEDGVSDPKKEERRLNKILEKGEQMKAFILRLSDKKYLRKRNQLIARLDSLMLDSDAFWAVKYLASKREFSQSFEHFLKQITYGVSNESSVGVRTKAMRCLTQIIEADHKVLLFQDVQAAVNGRLIDTNTSVREATAELLGKYVISRPELLEKYYPMIIQRIADTGVAVRKRVIRILRDLVERHPTYDRIPEILTKVIRRVQDEEGVKKLVVESMFNIWFQPVSNKEELDQKITTIADTMSEVVNAGYVDFFKQLVSSVCKEYEDKGYVHEACVQIIDGMVDKVLSLDQEMAHVDLDSKEMDKDRLERKRVVQRRLIACLSTLSVFSSVKPQYLIRHAEVFGPYLDIKPNTATEYQVLVSILQMLERVVPLMEHPGEHFLKTLDRKLDDLLQAQNNLQVINATVACAGATYKKFPKYCPAMISRFKKFLEYLKMTKQSIKTMQEVPREKLGMLRKVMFSVGVISRFFDLDAVAAKHGLPDLAEEGGVRKVVLDVLCCFCTVEHSTLRLLSLKAFGQLTAECPEYLLNESVQKVYTSALKDRRTPILLQALNNLSLFLVTAEEKAIKSNEKFQVDRDGDLKVMELGNSGISSAAIQCYWHSVLHSYFNKADDVRQEAANVIFQTQNQGLLTPGSAIPTLIAMCADRLPSVRNKIETLVKEIDAKYAGMVNSKAIAGIRRAYHLQDIIRTDPTEIVRGIRAIDLKPQQDLPTSSNDVQAMLHGLYSCIRTNRQQRRGFLTNLLRLFSENSKAKVSLEEWIFIADNLAHFNYVNLDEPLFVIHTTNKIVSLAGQNIMTAFRKQQRSSGDGGADDEEFNPNVIYARMPEDKTELYELQKESYGCYLLLALKSYLMRVYNFKDDKIKEYSPSESAKIYEKPVTRRPAGIFSPKSILDACKKNPTTSSDSIQSHIELAQHFSYVSDSVVLQEIVQFFNKLLLMENEDQNEEGGVSEPEQDEEAMDAD